LVDELGSIEDAINYAASIVNISDYGIEELPKYEMNFRNMLGGSLIQSWNTSASPLTQKVTTQILQLEQIFKLKGPQARMPFEMVIE